MTEYCRIASGLSQDIASEASRPITKQNSLWRKNTISSPPQPKGQTKQPTPLSPNKLAAHKQIPDSPHKGRTPPPIQLPSSSTDAAVPPSWAMDPLRKEKEKEKGEKREKGKEKQLQKNTCLPSPPRRLYNQQTNERTKRPLK